MPTISVNGLDAYYEDDDFTDDWRGDVETIVIQHGIGRNSVFWNHWVPPLAGRYRVIRRDLRGFGRSGDPGPDYVWAMEDLLADLEGFLDALGLDSVHYLGESIGGPLGIAFAASRPGRLKSLALCSSPTELKSKQQFFALGQKSRADVVANIGVEGMTRALIERGMTHASSPEHAEWVVRQWCLTPPHVMTNIAGLSTTFDVGPLLGQVAIPTLVMAPANSPATTLADQIAMAKAIPGAQIVVANRPGHEIYITDAEVCIAAYQRFLAEPVS